MDLTLLQHPLVKGAIAGLVSAALVDFAAFRAFDSFDDIKTYNWTTAVFRWWQGAMIGLATAAGIGAAA
jgi:hypothetical protein